MTEFRKWTNINKFSDVRKLALRNGVNEVTLGSKVKLHGSNAGVRLTDNGLVPQKRSGDAGDGHFGFKAWVESIPYKVPSVNWSGVIFYGEWAGKGIQKSDAVSSCEKAFYIFSVYDPVEDVTIVEPAAIKLLWNNLVVYTDDVHIIPWFEEDIKLNFLDEVQSTEVISKIVDQVDEIGKCDPYIKSLHGVEGEGEGLVVYMTDGCPEEHRTDYMFKVKTESHSVNSSKNRKTSIPIKPEGMEDFIATFVTDARMEQMVFDNVIEYSMKNTGAFIKAVMTDIYKESVHEVEAADFEWKDAPKYLTPVVKKWWFDKCNSI